MAAKYNLTDDKVVVVIGSGAGGGTLAAELAIKGIDTVLLEAGNRWEIPDFENDEWSNFVKISWLDPRSTSGNWRVAKDFSGLPAWIVRAVGGSTIHWAGASLRIEDHEFKARTTYGDIAGATLLDWPLTRAELDPYYDRAEKKMGTTGTNGIPRLPGNNNYKVLAAGAAKMGTRISTPATCRSTRSRATAAAPVSRSASASRAASRARSGRPFTRRSRRARRAASWRCGPTPWRYASCTTPRAR